VDSVAGAALASWTLNPWLIALLLATAAIYLRGWIRGRRLFQHERDYSRLSAFFCGLMVLFLALDSPLDAFDSLFLSAHMTQHLLLLMVAPPLILVGYPMLPLLRGLPKRFVKEGLGPFLSWPLLQRVMRRLVWPPVAFSAFVVSTIFWHLPKFYELAVRSPSWHGAQHAFFFWTGILFWWPVVQFGPGKPRWPRGLVIPHLLLADIFNTVLSAFFVFSGRLLYPSYAAVRASRMSAQDDQTLAGLIMWVPGSIIYLIPAFVIVVRLLSGTQVRRTTTVVKRVRKTRQRPLVKRFNLPKWRRVAQVAMLLLAIAIMVDGFSGSQVAPMNLAGVLPWIHWRALSILALLVAGNLFCMVCPFTLARDIGRILLPAKLRWPRRLRTKWLPLGLIAVYLWAYEAFGLWNSPWLTASVIAGYFIAAVAIDGVFRGASFCKYVCPIGQFHFVASLVSPREVRVRSSAVCKTCRTHDCIRGNQNARGCELYLFQPKKSGNLDCTFCLDCVKACPHDNVGILPTAPAGTLLGDPYRSSIGRLSKRTDLAALALLIVFGAFVNAAGMVAPVMMWEHGWHARLGARSMPAIVGAVSVLGLLIAPLLAFAICAGFNRLQGRGLDLARRFVFTLVPVGIAMWAAHLLYHFATGWGGPWIHVQAIPAWLTSAQIVLLDAGVLLTLYVGWRVALQSAGRARTAIGLLAPWAGLACTLYGVGVWILFQPMQMRGMLP